MNYQNRVSIYGAINEFYYDMPIDYCELVNIFYITK